MFAIIGILVVIGAIVGGYLMEHGKLLVLFQPAELVIIFGAAVGTILVGNPLPVVIRLAKGMLAVFKGSPYNKTAYLESLNMLNDLSGHIRKVGLSSLETDLEAPDKSAFFSKHPKLLKNHEVLLFICDTLRTYTTGGAEVHQMEELMELDLEVQHKEAEGPVAALATMADSLPGLGIVAAVLGVVITMGALGGPAEEIGHKVAAALVGTFLGILLCYGFFGPIAAHMRKLNEEEGAFQHFLVVALTAFFRGLSPLLAIEFARRSVPTGHRPSFQEMEATCRKKAA